MALSLGIVGLPNVGKSTLFNALTNNQVLAANYPFATIEPNTGVVPVPDERLTGLAEIYQPAKVIPATITFTDIAGLVKGAHAGEGLGNQFLAHIREANAVVQVVRAFTEAGVTHVANRVDPEADIEILNTELILADLQTINKTLERLTTQAKADTSLKGDIELADKIKSQLGQGRLVIEGEFAPSKLGDSLPSTSTLKPMIKQLLTNKPLLYVFNVDEATLKDSAKQQQLIELVKPAPALCIDARLEAELAELPAEEARQLLATVGQSKSGLELLIQASYRALDLITFLTAGPKEVRAWTVRQGARAPQAAGVIHGDFERGFIAAEVVSFDDLIEAGSVARARAAGRLRAEGKDYQIQDGDVIEFKFNL